MKPKVTEFRDDTELIKEVKNLAARGIDKENLYFMSHDDDRNKRVADSVDASTVGMKEEGLGTFVKNISEKKVTN